ncbi:MAG: DUF1211 domain-containing protein [Bacteroidetes bacterium]|nr:DUF1211 domain-containing protein [Bacteroidota bacterium]
MMNKSRLEAFSDGVFAIVITLLILDVHVPKVPYDQLPQALLSLLPNVFSYALSFIIVGLYWISHHNMLLLIHRVDRPTLWINILLLLFVGFIPFPAALMAEYPLHTIPVVLYGCALLASNAIGYAAWLYAATNRRLLKPDVTDRRIRAMHISFLAVNISYVIAIGMAFVYVPASYAIFVFVIAIFVIPKPWDPPANEAREVQAGQAG